MPKNPEIDSNGTKVWRNAEGELHRLDGPAFTSKTGHKSWYKNNKRHRLDGPAVTYKDGEELWFINGKRVEPIPDIICVLRRKLKDA